MKTPKFLILDAGGVLVYPPLGEWHVPFRAAEILGLPRAGDIGTPRFKSAQAAAMQWLDEGRLVMTLEEERALRRRYIRDIDAAMGWRMTEREIDAMTDDFTDNPDRYAFFDDVEPFLNKWKARFRLGILSDAMPSLYPLMEGREILSLFDAVVISTHVGATKPDPAMYRAILDRLGAKAEDCVFVDDRIVNLLGARAVGMAAIQMSRPRFPAEALWDGPVAHGFREVDDLLSEGATP